MSFITGVGLTSYGKHEGLSSLDLMSKAAELAVADAGLKRAEIDGILCGYSTVSLVDALNYAREYKGLSLIHIPVYYGPHELGGMGVFGRWNVGNWSADVQALRHKIGL